MCTHLAKRNGRYYIRRRVPLDLVSVLGKKEITKALGTSERAEAVRLCRAEGLRLDQLFASARSRPDPVASRVQAITSDVPPATASSPFPSREAEEAHDEAQAVYSALDRDHDAAQHEEAVERTEAVLREAHRRAGIPLPEKVPTPHEKWTAQQDAAPRARVAAQQVITKAAQSPSVGKPPLYLSSVIDAWSLEKKPTSRTVGIALKVSTRFRDLVGLVPVSSIERLHVVAFKDALLASGQTAVNTDKQLTLLSTLLNFATLQGHLPSNPAKGIKVGERRNAKAARIPFDLPALQRIFGSPIYAAGERPGAGGGEAAYWLPLLALYTGARLEELAQLAPSDIQEAVYTDTAGEPHTAWVIRVSDEGDGQELKTVSSRRRIPIHADLVALGFVDYATGMKGPRIFPDLKPDITGSESGNWSKWFSKHLRGTCKVTDKRMVFHSFRHLFKHTLRELHISEEISDALTGHSSGSVGRRYGATLYPLAPLVDAMSRFRVHGLHLAGAK
jgi:integrase